ncbi:hypothetical protein SESBI_27189 [Sesbania bispinosa]|nr:hypothetical protein SESBI_27189 [Sesbania bispinosa]
MRYVGRRRRRVALLPFLILCVLVTGLGLFMLALIRPLDPPRVLEFHRSNNASSLKGVAESRRPCRTVEEMGKDFRKGVGKESLRVRRIIHNHFLVNGASRVRGLPPEQFCSHGFVLGKTTEAGFGNEMYKVLTAAALSALLTGP